MRKTISLQDFNNMEDDLYYDFNIIKDIDYACAIKHGEAHLICDARALNTILNVGKENNIEFTTVLPWGCDKAYG